MINKIFKYVFFIYLALFPLIPTEVNEKIMLDYVLIFLFILMFFIKSISSRNERSILLKRIIDCFKDPIVITMLLAIIIMALSSTYALNKVRSLTESFRFFTYLILYIAIKYEFNIRKYFNRYYILFFIQSLIIFLYGIIQYFTGIGVKVDTNGTLRMESTLGYPTAFAAYIILMIFPLIMFFIKTSDKKLKMFIGIIILFGLIIIW